jgi:outer membrane protein assembly factor BamB
MVGPDLTVRRRRALLGGAAVAGAAGAGLFLTRSSTDIAPADTTAGWPAPRRGPRNAAFNPDATPPRSEPVVTWSAPVGGVDALVVSGGVAFVAESRGADPSTGGVAALDVADGTVVWDRSEPGATLCTAGDTLYVGTTDADDGGSPDVRALDAETGQQAWSIDPEASAEVFHLLAGSDTVYAGRLGSVEGLRRDDGRLRWRRRVGNGWTGTAVREGELYVSGGGETARLEPNTGLEALRPDALRSDAPGEQWATVSGPVFPFLPVLTDETVLVGGLNPEVPQRVVAYDRATGEVRWSTKPLGDRVQRPVVRQRLGYSRTPSFGGSDPTGGLVAFDLASGEVVWQRSLSSPTVPPIAADDVVVAGTTDGVVRGFDAADGTPLWSLAVGDEVRTLAAAGSTVFVGTDNGPVLALAE